MESRRKRILVVDPSQTFVRYLALILRRMGFTVQSSAHGLEALSLLRQGGFAAVICELELPGLDGISLLRCLKLQKETCELPVIVATTLDRPEIRHLCAELGAARFLAKPVTPGQLHLALQDQLHFPGGQRHHLRTPVSLTARLTLNGECKPLSVVNLSEGGAFLRAQDAPPTGTRVELELDLPGQPRFGLSGLVLYKRHEPGRRGFAVLFTGLGAGQQEILRETILAILASEDHPCAPAPARTLLPLTPAPLPA